MGSHQLTTVQHLQHALLELLEFEENEANDAQGSLDVCEPRVGQGELEEEESESESELALDAGIKATFSGVQGQLTLREGELLWAKHGATNASLRISISNVTNITTRKVFMTPPHTFVSLLSVFTAPTCGCLWGWLDLLLRLCRYSQYIHSTHIPWFGPPNVFRHHARAHSPLLQHT